MRAAVGDDAMKSRNSREVKANDSRPSCVARAPVRTRSNVSMHSHYHTIASLVLILILLHHASTRLHCMADFKCAGRLSYARDTFEHRVCLLCLSGRIRLELLCWRAQQSSVQPACVSVCVGVYSMVLHRAWRYARAFVRAHHTRASERVSACVYGLGMLQLRV